MYGRSLNVRWNRDKIIYIFNCSGLLHYKPRNTNLQQYPLVDSRISCAPRERKDKRWLERDCVLTETNTEVEE